MVLKDQCFELEKWKSKGSEGKPPKTHKASDNLVRNVVSAMRGMCLVPSSVQMPCWLEDRTARPYVSFTNGILDYERLCQDDENCLIPQSHNWFSLTTLPYAFDRNASCDRWQSFLEDALEGDLKRIYVLQEYAGYILLPDNRFHKALAQEGIGSNGKSVVQAGFTAMLGEKNVSGLSIENFANSFSIGETVGKLLNIAADMGNVDKIAEGMLKQVIGSDRVFVDRKHRDGMTIRPTAKFIASWNDRPRIRDRSNGIWRRLIVMPFRKTISDERKKLGMDDSSYWADEAPGICNWALIGLARLLRQNRFTQSKVCEEAAKAFKTESSPAAMTFSRYFSTSTVV